MRIWSCLIALLLSSCGGGSDRKYEEETIPSGYVGQARVNPYLAAERFLKADGWNAASKRVWTDFGPETSTIILPAGFLSSKGIAMRALDWVDEGGLLVITMEGGEAEINDFVSRSLSFSSDETEKAGLDYLMEELEVTQLEGGFEKVASDEDLGKLANDWNVADISLTQGEMGYDLKVEFQGDVALRSQYGEAWEEEEESGTRMLTTLHGDGSVMFLAHARPFRNAYVDRASHPQFIQVIAGWNTNRGGQQIVFLYGSGTSLFDLLWQHAWPALAAGILLLLVWLWMRIPRFGPVREDDFTYRRPYGEGLRAAATFLWRKRALEYYLKPLRSSLQGELDSDQAVEKLVHETALTADDVKQALSSQTFRDPGAVTRMVRSLQLLLKR